MPSLGWLPFQQAKNPIDAATESASAVTNIFDAINRAKTSAVQRALAQQELQHQIAIAPLQQQALQLQNQAESAKIPYIGPLAQANIEGTKELSKWRDANATYKGTVAPSIVDKNEASAGLSGARQSALQQTMDQNDAMNPIKIQDAQTRSAALPGQIQSNLDLVKARMTDMGVHTHNQEIMGPLLAGHMDAATQQLHAKAVQEEASTAVMAKALAAGTDTKDSAAPQNVAQHWDWNQPDAIPNFLNYTQLYTQQKLDPSGQKALFDKDGSFTSGIQAAGKTLGMGIVNERLKQEAMQQQNQAQSQQIRQGLMQLLGGAQQPPQGSPGGADQVAQSQATPPSSASPPASAPTPAASPQSASSPAQAAPQYPEGAIFRLPSTGQRYKIINGQPVEILPNAGTVAPN